MMFRVPPLPSSVLCAAATHGHHLATSGHTWQQLAAAAAAVPSRAFSAPSSSVSQRFRPRSAPSLHAPSPADPPLGPNDEISTHVRNRRVIHSIVN